MSTPPHDPNALLKRLQAMIDALLPVSGTSNITSAQLETAEQQLNDILPMLQFECMDAEDAGNWELVDQLNQAIDECRNTLNAVRAVILRSTIIGLKNQEITELREIRNQINKAAQTQRQFEALLRAVGFVRQLATKVLGW